MAQGSFVSYLRVSTGKQGASGLGLEAQRETVRTFLNGGSWELVGEFVEVESGTAKGDDRPELDKALARCRVMGATLIVANVSRLTRNPDFMARLVAAGVEVRFCDLPKVEGPAGRFMLRQMLAVAELEAGLIAERTRKALAQKKAWYADLTEEQRAELRAKGKATQLGGDRGNLQEVGDRGRAVSLALRQEKSARRAADLAPIVAEVRASGAASLREIASALNARRIPTARGGSWSAVQVKRLLEQV
jgi:DNA invertase Pin-like site-specific DNA recombinase